MKLLIASFSLFVLSQSVFSQKLDEKYITAQSSVEGKIYDNETVQFRILDEIKLNDIVIPENTFFYATAKFVDGRALFSIEKIKVVNDTYAISLTLVSADLKEGLPYPKKKDWLYLSGGMYQFLVRD